MTIEPIEVNALIREVCKNINEEISKGNILVPPMTGEVYVGTLWQELGPILADKYVESKINIQSKAELERKRALINNIYSECKNILRGFIWQNLGIDMSPHSMELSQLTEIYKANQPDNTRLIEETNKIAAYYKNKSVRTVQEILGTQKKFKKYLFDKETYIPGYLFKW